MPWYRFRISNGKHFNKNLGKKAGQDIYLKINDVRLPHPLRHAWRVYADKYDISREHLPIIITELTGREARYLEERACNFFRISHEELIKTGHIANCRFTKKFFLVT